MALIIEEAEKQKLFRQVKHRLGAPLRKIELDDEQLCTLLEIAIEDYSSYINDWLIEEGIHTRIRIYIYHIFGMLNILILILKLHALTIFNKSNIRL
jgi:hypothetical protein